MTDSIKITSLNSIGANIAYTTLIPVVNMAGTPITQKATAQLLGNLILEGAGGSYFPQAAQATLAQTVTNAAQPNITSVGTLTSLAVTGNVTAGNVNGGNIVVANFYYGDGGFLTNVSSGYSNSNVAAYLPTYTGNVGASNVNVTGTVYANGISSTGLASLTTLNVSTTANLGAVANVRISGGSAGQVLTTNGNSGLSWTTVSGGSSTGNITFTDSNISTNAAADINVIGSATGNVSLLSNNHIFLNVDDSIDPHGGVEMTWARTSANVTQTAGISINSDFGNNEVATGNVQIVACSNLADGLANSSWTFGTDGKLAWPGIGAKYLGNGAAGQFEIHSDANIVIGTDIGNSDRLFVFDQLGDMYMPGNVTMDGTNILAGPGANALNLANSTLVISSTSNAFIQAVINNVSDIGSADWVAQGHYGNDDGGWVDMGFTSASYSDPDYTMTGPGDGYIITQAYLPGQAPAIGNGSLIFATGENGAERDIIFGTGGFLTANIFGRISDANNLFELSRANAGIKFTDGSIQTTAYTGGAGSELINGNNSFVLDSAGNVVFEGTPSGNAVDRGLVWDYGANVGGVNSQVRQDINGITVRAWTESGGMGGSYAAPVNIVTNQDANTNTWRFDGQGNLTVPGNINSISDAGDLGAYITLTPDLGIARLAGRDIPANVNYTNTSWSTATYTGTQIDFTNAPDLVAFFTNNTFNAGVNQTISINGNEPVPFTGYTTGVSNAVTVYTSVTADPDPTTVTSIDFSSQLESYVAVDYDGGELVIGATGLTIMIDNDQTQGPDINLRSGDDITLQAKDKSLGSESEGGDINILAGDGADDDGQGNTASTGGDIQITAGNGGDGNSGSGSAGGFTQIYGGTGGTAGVTNTAGPGGYVSINGGDGGYDTGNTQLGAGGGYVSIAAGLSTQEGVVGPNVTITSGQGGPNALAGSVVISTPASVGEPGGDWVFDGYGNLTLPGNTFAVNYANGTPVSIGAAALGNVTFDNVTVQGVNGLNLSAGSDFTANLAYLQVRAGDVASHIHLDTGNNQAYDLIVGDDQNYVQVSSTGNILLSSYDSNTAQYTWTLDYNGNLILAGGNSVIQSIANSSLDILNPNVSTMVLTPDPGYGSQALVLDPTTIGHIHLRSPGSNIDQPSANLFLGGEASSFEVGQYNGAVPNLFIHSNNNTWTFDIAGNLTLPQLTTISDESGIGTTLTVGVPPTVIVISGADVTAVNLTYTRAPGVTPPTWTSPVVNPASDPYIEFSGGEYGLIAPDYDPVSALYVNTGTLNKPLTQWNTNPPLGSVAPTAVYTYGASGPDWVFGDDGILTVPGNLIAASASPAPSISGFSSVSALAFTNGNSNVTVNANSNLWNFDSTGNLTIPSTSGGFIKTASNASIGIAAVDNGTNNPAQLLSLNAGTGAATSIVSAYASNATIQTNATGTINTWAFDNAGNLTLPGNTFAINYANGTQVSLGGGNISEISNGNSNVNIATANGNVTIAAVGNTTMTITGTGANITGTANVTGNITGDNVTAAGLKATGTITANGGAYGEVVITQFASVFGSGSGPNPQSLMQVRGSDGIAGMGIRAYTGLPEQIYANTGITFTTGATIRDKDTPSGGTTRATLDSAGLSVVGIVKTAVYTTSTIPAAATAGAGARAFVTDADSATFKAAYVGGSGNAVPVFSDGSAWYVG